MLLAKLDAKCHAPLQQEQQLTLPEARAGPPALLCRTSWKGILGEGRGREEGLSGELGGTQAGAGGLLGPPSRGRGAGAGRAGVVLTHRILEVEVLGVSGHWHTRQEGQDVIVGL